MKRYSQILLLAIVLLPALGSCTKENLRSGNESVPISVPLTKSAAEENELAPDGSTYAVILFFTNSGISTFSYHTTGYYQYRDDGDVGTVDYLHAARLEDDGTYIEDDDENGLNRVTGTYPYDVTFVSPGIKIDAQGRVPFRPNAGDAEGNLLVAGRFQQTFGTYRVIQTDSLLRDRRCFLKFRVFKANKFNSIKVNSITVKGAGSCGPESVVYYKPATRQAICDDGVKTLTTFSNGGVVDESSPVIENPSDPDLTGLKYTESEKFYIASGIYAPIEPTVAALQTTIRDNVDELDYLRMEINLDQDGRTGLIQTLILNNSFPELSPQHEYIFNIIVASTYIAVYLDVYSSDDNDWQNVLLNTDMANYQSSWKKVIGTWPIGSGADNNWSEPVIEEQQIGDYN